MKKNGDFDYSDVIYISFENKILKNKINIAEINDPNGQTPKLNFLFFNEKARKEVYTDLLKHPNNYNVNYKGKKYKVCQSKENFIRFSNLFIYKNLLDQTMTYDLIVDYVRI